MVALKTQSEQSQQAQASLNTAVAQLPGQLIAARRDEEQRKKEEKKQKSKDRRNRLKFWQ